ncbi:SDR family oxidoreductase [Bradyrhizobium sp. LHD-71]|uniref:SDR family NAD(P)-dependent oxidoreductase n=1 Tax=Bradyrhizobium sp. LHD-71 TaxID=3072141 RepID=UPI00280C9B42|nr:SDR family oxidoreductase [Bradyrhizobium sp. LHD-71]MDQ8729662.1 SDR family oxidoreductase [Bradyrhizobium sp. LHD-71]
MAGRVALITGASAGIGCELARIFARNGHHVALVARRLDRLKALSDEIVAAGGQEPLIICCDLQRPDAGDVISAALASAAVEPEYLVNNAGFGLFGEWLQLGRTEQLAMVDVNVRALTDLSLRFADCLARHRGGILNVASLAGFLPGPRMAVYYATKAYVISYSEALFCELAPRGVRVTALCPGAVPTEFQARAGIVPGFDSKVLSISAADVAMAGYRGLMAGKRLVLPGVGMKMIPFMLRFVPRAWVVSLVGRVQGRHSV